MEQVTNSYPICIGQICQQAHTVDAGDSIENVKQFFDKNQPISCVVVIQNHSIAGMMMNIHLNLILSQRYGFSLFNKKPISRLMDPEPMIVQHTESVETIAELAMKRENDKLYDHIIVTRDDRLHGIVAVRTILNTLVSFQKKHAGIQKKYTEKLEIDDLELKRALKKSTESKKILQLVIDAIPHAIYWKDKNCVYMGCNQTFAEDAGVSDPKKIKGKTDAALPWTLQEAAVFRAQDQRIMKAGQAEINAHQVQTNIKGTKQFLATSKIPLHNPEKEVVGILCVYEDITLKLKRDNERIRLEKQLSRAQKMEAIGRLAGVVAHDLNNILSGIVSYPELIMMDLPENSPIIPSLEAIQKSGERAAAVVYDLLTLARRGVVKNDIMDINTMVTQYMQSPEFLRLKADFPRISFKARTASGMLSIRGSQAHLMKTLMNLVNNSAEAIEHTGEILIETESRYIDYPIKEDFSIKEGEYVVLCVTDNGMGIPPQDLDKIFEPFYTSKKMGRSGTGLGMSVVWGTVKDHDGYIDIESTPYEKTRISLYFPAKKPELKELTVEDISEQLMGNGESILVIDDVPEQRKIAASYLERLNYKVHTLENGEQAVAFIQKNPSDLIILDMIMEPGMDGLETYMKILEIQPGTPAVITSGFSESERVKQALMLGAGPYLKKPYNFNTLGRAVRARLEQTG